MTKRVLPLVAIAVVAAASLAGGYFESLRTARAITSEADGSEATTLMHDIRLARKNRSVSDAVAGNPLAKRVNREAANMFDAISTLNWKP